MGEVRVFHDVSGTTVKVLTVKVLTVKVLAVVAKSEAEAWLAQLGNPE
jgi:hypothetical protein